jgi:parallel beta-helix repeat protein
LNRTVCGIIVLVILLTSFLTFSTHGLSGAIDGEPSGSNKPECNPVGNLEKPIVSEHKTTASELEQLKQSIGVWQANHDYNELIYGHGTGLRPPTDDEWAAIMNNSSMVENVQVDSAIQTTSSVDLTTTQWFPPIGNQGSQGSCVAWAVGYYMKTFQEAREHNWSLSGGPSDKVMSPSFIYNLINGGVDGGSSYNSAIQLICSVGASSLAKMQYNAGDYTSWPSEEAWSEAMLYRGDESGLNYMSLASDAGLANLKSWLASENLAILGVDASKIADPFWGTSRLDGNDMLTLDNYVNPSPNHAGTIVGYDDNFAYTEQGQIHYGAFKIANSWGIGGLFGWENIYDGCYWISYEAMKQRVGSCMFYNDRIGYEPELTAIFEMSHAKRGECYITVGVGNVSDPIVTKSFNQYVDGGNWPFCLNKILFDITEFRNVISIDSQQCFLQISDYGSSTTGTLLYFAINSAVSSDPPVATVDGQSVFANLALRMRLRVPEDFPTIQNAINFAYPRGYIILVAPGIYYENLIVNKTVSLIGEDRSNTIIDASSNGTVVMCSEVSEARISNFTIQNGGYAGIGLDQTANVTVSGNIMRNNSALGMIFHGENRYDVITGNDIANNGGGVVAAGGYVRNCVIAGNNITGNMAVGLDGFDGFWYENMIIGNNITYNQGTGVQFTVYHGGAHGNIIFGNNIMNNEEGILFYYPCSNNTISGNNISANTGWGISLLNGPSNNSILGNTIAYNGNGVFLRSYYDEIECSNNSVIGNDIRANNGYGILLQGATGNCLLTNDITNNQYGIDVNSIDWSWSEQQSRGNIICENRIAGNVIRGIEVMNSSNNFIYHNNFQSNTAQVYAENSSNMWDDGYPSGGNYWIDYTGLDVKRGYYQNETGSDGIGDFGYIIDSDEYLSSIDRYPLMKPYAGPHDIGITRITPSRLVVVQGYMLNISFTILNYGINTETLNITTYANTTIIATFTNITVEGRNSIEIPFVWNTTGSAYGNWIIGVYAPPVPGETEVSDNQLIGGQVLVSVLGDVNGDGRVDIFDAIQLANAFGTSTGQPGYNANADINNSGRVDIFDAILLANNFNRHVP